MYGKSFLYKTVSKLIILLGVISSKGEQIFFLNVGQSKGEANGKGQNNEKLSKII